MKNYVQVILTLLVLPYFSYAQLFGGQLKPQEVSNISALDCNFSINSGTLTEGVTAVGVSSVIPYSGGDGSSHNGQTVNSTGVIGLTAILAPGSFAVGSGSLNYSITGTPSSSGISFFLLTIGGQSCSLSISVLTASSPVYPSNSVFCANGPTTIVEVTNPITGKIWMDRNLGATQVATSSTDVNAYGDLYQWGRRSDGHQCRTSATTTTLSTTDQPANASFILAPNLPYDWRNPQNDNLWQGINGVNNPCPSGYRLPTELELNAERLSWSVNTSAGAFASALKLPVAGRRLFSNGSLGGVGNIGHYWSSTVGGVGSQDLRFDGGDAFMNGSGRAYGYSVRCLKDVSSPQGSINTIDCGSSTNNGTLTSGTAASGVSSLVPYSGGNGDTHNGQTVTSIGVSGLTAVLAPGSFAVGSGSLNYSITGTPSSSGIAIFLITIGGQSCSLSINVLTASTPVYPSNSVFCANGPTSVVEVTNPNTGKIWMDRNLGATQVATSSTDAASYGDLYQWGRRSDGHQCRYSATTTTLSSTDQPVHGDFILNGSGNFDWRSSQNNNLWQGVSGINNPCPSGFRLPTQTELTDERTSWSSNNSIGAFASSLKWSMAGSRDLNFGSLNSVGSFGRYWSSTISTSYSRIMTFSNSSGSNTTGSRAAGYSVRCIKDASSPQGAVNTIDCGSATNSGILTSGTTASGVSSIIPYTGGNGGTHNGQTVTSTGVTGLTATLSAGTFANGAGSLTYTITGTPSASGTASFALTIGGQGCILIILVNAVQPAYPAGTVHCNAIVTLVNDVTNPITGKTWMDRNLGASQVAVTSNDPNSYGDLYQWGRRSDGHQCRNSATTITLSSTDQPSHGDFILAPNSPFDWRSPQNVNLWQGVNGVNNPCPSGYRIPTNTELNAERSSWSTNNAAGAFASPLKLTRGGGRDITNGSIYNLGVYGYYWSSNVNNNESINLYFLFNNAIMSSYNRSDGFSVRCIKDFFSPQGAINTLDCGSATNNGTLTSGTAASGVSSIVPYTGGNGGTHNGQTVTSTGVTGLSATLTAGTFANGAGSLTYTISGTASASGTASFALNIGGQTCTLTRTVDLPASSITALICGSATNNGTLTAGTAASGVSSLVPYSGGNGDTHIGQTVTSSGVTGLTATLAAGTFANGAGTLTYTITGTPSASGTANFALNIGGQSCILNILVYAVQPAYPAGTVHCNAIVTLVNDVTNPITGKTWMDRNLGASQVATSSADAAAYGDLYQWGRRSDGHQCRNSNTTSTLSSTDQPMNGNFILTPNSPFDWRNPQNTNLWQGINGINNPCPIGYRIPTSTELDLERSTWINNNLDGAFDAQLKLTAAGARSRTNGSITGTTINGFIWSSSVSSTNANGLTMNSASASITAVNRALGGSVRCLKDVSSPQGSINNLNCGTATNNGTLTAGTAASGVSSIVTYTGGNGGTHNGQTVTSSGVTSLTATLAAGTFANGAGTLTYTITGTPSASGTASFVLNIGGQTCSLNLTVSNSGGSGTYPPGSVFCTGTPTAIVDVTNPTTGSIWMDRNLGATQVATSITDANSYGDLYQWGRRSDGHQCRTSPTTSSLSSTNQPANGNFILAPNSPYDWRSPQSSNLWQGVNGINNPCPSGYRLPTETELNTERLSWVSNNAAGAFASPLKLPAAGYRSFSFGSLNDLGTYGSYWSSTVSSINSRFLDFYSSGAIELSSYRAYGLSVRCIKD